jgi:hydroxymethylpyrimidine pyrophosphatase-like HAD family hydrolase
MRFRAVATDYDGTIADDGRVEPSVVRLLEAVRASGRKLILVTGRHLPDLRSVFPRLRVFDLVVAENGALLYDPATGQEELLSETIPAGFIAELQNRGVTPLSLGRGIVATRRSQERAVLDAIRDLGLDLQVIPNKDSVMVLPAGINKGTGLKAALRELGISAHNLVGLGDAENDDDFLRLCECSMAVANALDSVKKRVDIVTHGEDGQGASEILRALLADDLVSGRESVA